MQEKNREYYLRLILNIVIPLSGWLLVCFAGPWLLRFFMPFVIGWLLAMLADPLVRFLERRSLLIRRHSSLMVVALALALVIGILYLVAMGCVRLVYGFLQELPVLYASIQEEVTGIIEKFGHLPAWFPKGMQQAWLEARDNVGNTLGILAEKAASPTAKVAGNVAKRIPSLLVYSIVTILSAYSFIVEREKLLESLKRILPPWAEKYQIYLRDEVFRLLGGYFLAQVKIMGVIWCSLTIGFLVLGVGYAPFWALLIAILDFLPIFGTGTVLWPWAAIKILGGEYAFGIGLLLVYLLALVTRQLVQPKLVGDSLGLNPLMTLLFLYLGFKLKGIAGMILAVPIGMFFLNLYHFGAFDHMLSSIRILSEDIREFRYQDKKE